jgi:hypothetical protein
MAKINVKPEEFPDIVVSFLLDKLLHPKEVVPENEEFNDVAKKMKDKALNTTLMQYYLGMDARKRNDYKRIKDVFDGTSQDMMVINISPFESKKKREKAKKKEGIIKKVINKLIKKESLDSKELSLLLEELEVEDNE